MNLWLNNLTNQQNDELNFLGYTKLGRMNINRLSQFQRETKQLIETARQQSPKGELFNLINASHSLKSASIELVKKYLVNFVQSKLSQEKLDVLPIAHIIKPFGRKSSIWHQDSSVVDERKDFSLNAWMPFVKSTRLNGCMWMFPGSHVNDNYFRQFAHNYITKDVQSVFQKQMVPLTVEAGEILLFHRNIIHGSSINWLPKPRIACECLIVPKGCQLFNYHREEAVAKDKIMAFKVDLEHYQKANPKEDFYNGRITYDLIDDHDFTQMQQHLMDSIPQFIAQAQKLKSYATFA